MNFALTFNHEKQNQNKRQERERDRQTTVPTYKFGRNQTKLLVEDTSGVSQTAGVCIHDKNI